VVDVNAAHLPRLVWKQGLERDEIVALDDEVANAGVAAAELWHVLEQVERHFMVMFDDGILADPIESGHGGSGEGVDGRDARNGFKIFGVLRKDDADVFPEHEIGKLAVEIVLTPHFPRHAEIERFINRFQRKRKDGQAAQAGDGANFFPCQVRAVGRLVCGAVEVREHFRKVLDGNAQLHVIPVPQGEDFPRQTMPRITGQCGVDQHVGIHQHPAGDFVNAYRFPLG
jgi:hypothetical protein